jgi:hypothetical protein
MMGWRRSAGRTRQKRDPHWESVGLKMVKFHMVRGRRRERARLELELGRNTFTWACGLDNLGSPEDAVSVAGPCQPSERFFSLNGPYLRGVGRGTRCGPAPTGRGLGTSKIQAIIGYRHDRVKLNMCAHEPRQAAAVLLPL